MKKVNDEEEGKEGCGEAHDSCSFIFAKLGFGFWLFFLATKKQNNQHAWDLLLSLAYFFSI